MGPRFTRKALGRLVNGAVMAGLLGVPGTAHAQPPYTFEKINFPGSIATHPSGINDSGLIIGTFLDAEREIAIELPNAAAVQALMAPLEAALKDEDRAKLQRLCQSLADAVIDAFKLPAVRMEVLAARPSDDWKQ